ncbi:MAG: tetratricopeptide repeat protein [Rhodothermales bacterium]|nr:tetratricopeptide repeat protein [Rhodothermales bacterium]
MHCQNLIRSTLPGLFVIVLSLLVVSCGRGDHAGDDNDAPVLSLDGRTLTPVDFTAERYAQLEENYLDAQRRLSANADNVENHIWFGRRAAYLWRYREAINIFSRALEQFPDEPRLYRHRGHRYITVRDFERAKRDLEYAAKLIEGTEDTVEPDGAPNAAGIPVSTLHTNIWYHLGLTYYLTGRFDDSAEAFQQCLELSTNDDMKVASSDWLYMSLRRSGREMEALAVLDLIDPAVDLLENHSYLKRLSMYKGLTTPDSLLFVDDMEDRALTLATQGYGVGNWYLYQGDSTRALQIFDDVLEGEYWPAFGYIAAEADRVRLTDRSSY